MEDLCDISTKGYGERVRGFLKSDFGKTGASPDLTNEDIRYCKEKATEEMMDEIHLMLRTLLLHQGIVIRG